MNDPRSQQSEYEGHDELLNKKSTKPNIANIDDTLEELTEEPKKRYGGLDDEDDDGNDNIKPNFKDKKNIIIICGLIISVVVIAIILIIFSPKNKTKEKAEETNIETVQEEMVELETQSQSHLTEEDRSQLRVWGFTSDEIEKMEIDKVDVQAVIKDAKEKYINERLDIYKSFVRESNNNPDEQYQYILANSWWGQEPKIIDKGNKEIESYTDRANVDYYKYPPQGNQYFIKIKFPDNGDVLFVNVSAVVYHKLDTSGNCIISYDYTKMYGVGTYSNVKVVLE